MSEILLSSLLDGFDKIRGVPAFKGDNLASREISVNSVMEALHAFTDVNRYLLTRRRTGGILELSNEAAVQDLLYLMLRPWVIDLVPETPTDKIANRYSIKDFASHSGRFVIEAKYIRTVEHGKSIAKEINDDIETYRYHPKCDDLIFFIYDPEGFIPDAAALERHVRTARVYDGRTLRCHGIIKP